MGLGMPIPDLSNKPGPGRPGWGPLGSYDFQFEVTGAVTIEAFPNTAGQSFTIKWQDGTTAQTTGSSTINSPAGAGIISINNELDNTYADEFKIVSGQTNVTKVVSWGNNAWSDVFEAFKDCVNLTDISTTSFLASGQGPNTGQGTYMESMFEGCTSLLEVDIRNWNLENGVSWRYNGPFINLANLEKLDATGLKIQFKDNASYSYNAFTGIGTNVATGCEFKLSGLDLSTSPSNYVYLGFFSSNKFKDGSNLSNIKWPTGLSNPSGDYALGRTMFNSSTILGTLNCSDWTTWNSRNSPSFGSVNISLTSQDGSKVNLSNLNLSGTWQFYNMFNNCRLYEVIGLNTWTATAGGANLRAMFKDAKLMRINPNDNFSSAFTSSLNPTYNITGNLYTNQRRGFYETCFNMGSLLLDSEAGAPPSFANVDFTDSTLANQSIFYRFGYGAKLTNTPDLTTAAFASSVPIGFNNIFERGATITDTNNHFVLNNQNLKISAIYQAFWGTNIRKITIGDNVDMSAITSFDFMFYTSGLPVNSIFLPSNADYSSLATIASNLNYFMGGNATGALSTCQVDTFIRRNRATNSNTNVNANLESNKITAVPSVARADADYLVNNQGWTINVGSPDTPLPFAYASYAVDPTGITTISPTTTPPAGSVFTATNSLSINSSTGVITIGSFRGGSTIRCTYPDGCYNEVVMLIQVPFTMRTKIPAGSSSFILSPQMSDGECFIDWGDTNSETLTGSTTHSYATSGSDQEYDIKLFDSPSGSKFTGFASALGDEEASYEKTILKWGDIEWQNNQWFGTNTRGAYRVRIGAPSGVDHKPNLSQVTSLYRMFGTSEPDDTDIGTGFFEDTNDNLEHWDVSTITNMSYMFRNPDPVTTKDDGNPNTLKCSNWDVSNVTNFNNFMSGYSGAVRGSWNTKTNIEMTNWNTSGATDMSYMFWQHQQNKLGIENFRTENVTNLSHFYGGGTWNAKTKMYNSVLRWDVSNVEDFSSASIVVGTNETNVNANFPNNWRFSTDASKNLNFYNFCGGDYMRLGAGPYYLTDLQAFATKTINETFYGGTSYTAWNMDNASSISNFGGSTFRGTPPLGLFRNYNIADWNITSKCTSFSNLWVSGRAAGGAAIPFDQNLSGWNVTSITGDQGYFMRGQENTPLNPVNMSTSNYDATLVGWGALAASVNSGVTVNFGTSKYSPGNALAVSRGNVSNPAGIPSGQMFVYDANVVLKDLTSVGDIVQLMNGGSSYGEFAKITGYLSTDDRVAFVDVLGGASFPVNWPGITWQYQIYDSDAAKGRYALLEAGWTITDGGVDIPFESAEIEIELAPGEEAMSLITLGLNTKIDWGDGNGFVNNPSTGQPYTGTYAFFTYPTVAAGTTDIYRIKVRENETETFSGWRFGFGYQYGSAYSGGYRVRKIITWGSHKTQNYSQAFQGADLNKAGFTNTLPVDANGKIAKPTWITSITSFSQAFKQANLPANADFSNWATGLAATNLNSMFTGNTNFIGTGLANWNVTKVTNINSFLSSTAFNSDISGWDLQSCTTASSLFANTPFNHSSISNLNLHNITNIASMFEGCTALNQDVNTKVVGSGASAYLAWDTDPVTEMYGCFKGCNNFNYSIGKWNIGQLSQSYGLASFFAYVATNVTGGYTHDLLTKDVTVGAGTPVAKTYVAWDVGQVNGFGISSQAYTTTLGMFYYSNFNGDISNWDMSGLGAQGGPVYSAAGQWGRVFQNATLFNQDISSKTITNVSGKGTYTAWDMSNWTAGRYVFYNSSSFNQNLGNWPLSTTDTSSGDMLGFFGYSNMSTANYTDTFSGWANTARSNSGFPKNKGFGRQYNRTFDTTRTNGITAFTVNTAGRARSYLTLDVQVSSGSSDVNGVYYYDYSNSKWVKEADANATIEWNEEESSWELKFEGEIQHAGSGGSQAAGPESSTSWSGGISVVDSSLGWSISNDTITT